jgi:asparagine synthetase B (glutamine-hydrolysing)
LNPAYTPYFLGRAVRELYPSAKVFLCGEGADEFFIGYPLLLEHESFIAKSISSLSRQPAERIADSPLLQQVERWQSVPSDQWMDLVRMFQRDQLLNLQLVPFDHGAMASSVECRVPYLDNEVIEFSNRLPLYLKVLDGSTKILLRLLLASLLHQDDALCRRLLSRRPSPAFFSTLRPRQWLRQLLQRMVPKSRLAASELALYSRNLEDLFWLGSVRVVFLKHRGRIEGLSFGDLAEEVINGSPN